MTPDNDQEGAVRRLRAEKTAILRGLRKKYPKLACNLETTEFFHQSPFFLPADEQELIIREGRRDDVMIDASHGPWITKLLANKLFKPTNVYYTTGGRVFWITGTIPQGSITVRRTNKRSEPEDGIEESLIESGDGKPTTEGGGRP